MTSLIYYDGWGQRSQLTFASGARSQWTSTATGAALQAWTVTPLGANAEINGFSQDANGNLSSGGGWNSLTHDAAGRLTAASGFGENVALTHDGFGNNTSSTMNPLPTGVNNFGFSAMTNNQTPSLTSSPTQASSGWNYQGNGEATQIGVGTGLGTTLGLTWDGLGRMNVATLNGETFTNTYAPTGLRVKVSDSLGYGTRGYAYTSGGLLLGEYDANGGWKRDVIYLGGEALAEVDAAGTHELHNDHLGSPRVITSRTTGQVEGRQVFGPYGERLPAFTSGYAPLTGYTGHVQQDPYGLTYMRGRFYTAAWHRFLNSDHGVDLTTFNQMAYVGGTPFQAIDPSGMSKKATQDCVNGKIVITVMDYDKGTVELIYTQTECGKGAYRVADTASTVGTVVGSAGTAISTGANYSSLVEVTSMLKGIGSLFNVSALAISTTADLTKLSLDDGSISGTKVLSNFAVGAYGIIGGTSGSIFGTAYVIGPKLFEAPPSNDPRLRYVRGVGITGRNFK